MIPSVLEREIKFEGFVSRELEPHWPGKINMWYTGQGYTHAGMIFNGVIWQHTKVGFDSADLAEFQTKHVMWRIDISSRVTKSYDFIEGYLEGRRGVGYGIMQLPAIPLPFLRPLLTNHRAMGICSESLAEAYNTICRPIFKDTDWILPHQVWNGIVADG